MNKLQLPQAKLLYAVAQIYRQRRIDQGQKKALKEKIMTDSSDVYELLEKYTKEDEIFDGLIGLLRKPVQEKVILEKDPERNIVMQATEQQQASSPWGQFLRRKKASNAHKHKHQSNAMKGMGLIKPQNIQ